MICTLAITGEKKEEGKEASERETETDRESAVPRAQHDDRAERRV